MSALTAQTIRAAQRGDEDARRQLALHWSGLALSWCRRMGGPKITADDAAQDALVIAMRKLDTLRDPERADAWLYGIVRRTLALHRRRSWWSRWLPWGGVEPVDPAADPFDELHRNGGIDRVELLLQSLPEIYREVLVLCVVEERTVVEVAGLLGTPEGTVKSRLRLARQRCRKAVDLSDLADAIPEAAPW